MGANHQTLPSCWGDLSHLSPGPSAVSAPATGREEVATCCHGSEPTYQPLHRGLPGQGVWLPAENEWHGSVGWAVTVAAGNQSHLAWPPLPTHSPPTEPLLRYRKWTNRGLGQLKIQNLPQPQSGDPVGWHPSPSLYTCLRERHRLCSRPRTPGAAFVPLLCILPTPSST